MAIAKLAQLRENLLKDGFEVVYGVDFQASGRKDFGFASIELTERYLVFTHHENFHDWSFFGEPTEARKFFIREYAVDEHEEKASEKFLFVIIPKAYRVETSCSKVAGRNPSEGIWKMYEGDIIVVSHNNEAEPQTYKVIRDRKKLFLNQKNR